MEQFYRLFYLVVHLLAGLGLTAWALFHWMDYNLIYEVFGQGTLGGLAIGIMTIVGVLVLIDGFAKLLDLLP